MSNQRRKEAQQRIRQLLLKLTDEEQKLLQRVLKFEKEHLHYKRPPRVKEDLLAMVDEELA